MLQDGTDAVKARDIFLVFVEGREGCQQQYADWFAGAHMADMRALPGVGSASAFRLEALDAEPVPAQLCAIYETGDGPGLLNTIASTKGTAALPASALQGPMTWRVLRGERASGIASASESAAQLICMFGGAWDGDGEARLWHWLGDHAQGLLAMRQTRLSPVQPSRGSEYSGVLFLALAHSADPAHLAQSIAVTRSAPFARFLVAHPMGGTP